MTNISNQPFIPLDLPDPSKASPIPRKMNYCGILKDNIEETIGLPEPLDNGQILRLLPIGEEGILLTFEEKLRLYSPWKFSVIIKLVGNKLNHEYLQKSSQTSGS